MIKEQFTAKRKPKTQTLTADLVIVGGGMTGTCAAITAARAGISVVLVQDRPVLGGNASSEVRLWILGATSHMGNNNRWAREGGVIDEILVENMYRNPEGNSVVFDTILLEKVTSEPGIKLLLNTNVFDIDKENDHRISRVHAFCSQNSTQYILESPWFCDASGDGMLAFSAGVPFRMGAECQSEFGEKFAPNKEYGELLGHTIYFYSKDTGKPVRFVAPEYALKDISRVPRFRSFNATDYGCKLWWIEFGGRLDTVHDTEEIKWQLWKLVYGIWHHIKNSGEFPEAENLTLEWVGTIPGKRESRRFEGEYMLRQQDLVEQRHFDDAVAFGGWSIDLHPADGVFSEKPGCNQWHTQGVYQIPFRCYYNSRVENLFFAGRIISASHVAFGSTRVMATCAHGGQAVGMAVALAIKNGWSQNDLTSKENIQTLQRELLKTGHHIPHMNLREPNNLVNKATISSSGELSISEIPFDGDWMPLKYSSAQMLPAACGPVPVFTLRVKAHTDTLLQTELRYSTRAFNYTPNVTAATQSIALTAGEHDVQLDFGVSIEDTCYVFLCLMKNPQVEVLCSTWLVTGLLTAYNKTNGAVSNHGKQIPEGDIGMDEFEFWCPHRRPDGKNFAMKISPALNVFAASNINNGLFRPTTEPNAWVAPVEQRAPALNLTWDAPQTIREIIIAFDTDHDHPMESSLMGHPETNIPFCVQEYYIYGDNGALIYECHNNYQTINRIILEKPVTTGKLVIQAMRHSPDVPVSIFEVQVY